MPMEIGTRMPPLAGATQWFNATAARAEAEAKGRPTLVHFWSINCEECGGSLRRLSQWRDRRAGEGLHVVAVHLPHSDEERDPEEIRSAVAELNITEPCAVDNEHKLRRAFGVGEVPAYYLFDGEGKLRSLASGARGLDGVLAELDRLLAPPERP